jgi:hypothetical protein
MAACYVCTTHLRMTCKKLRAALPPPPSILSMIEASGQISAAARQQLDWSKLSTTRDAGLLRQASYKYIMEHPDAPWDFARLSYHTEALAMVDAYPDKPWTWATIARQPGITIDFVQRHLASSAGSCAQAFTVHPVVTPSTIEAFAEMQWSWPDIGGNPNMDLAFFQRHQEKNIIWTTCRRTCGCRQHLARH